MGKKQKFKDISKKKGNNKDTIFSIKKTIKIDFIANKRLKSKNIYQRKKLNPSSKIFIPKKYSQLPLNTSFNSSLINKSKPKVLNSIIYDTVNDKIIIPKWMSTTTQNMENSSERFNSEITDYINYIVPSNFALTKRTYTIELLTHIIEKYNPNWKVILYGSFSQNISTIFSDLDFAIYNNQSFSSGDTFQLFYIMNILSNEGFSQDIEFINANCPILRGTCINTGINFDICFNKRSSGIKAIELVRNVVDNNTIIKQAVIFIKILLKIKNLNETFTGGMCSFLVFHLVYYFYTVYINQNKKENEKDNNKKRDCDNSFSKKKTTENNFSKEIIDINEQSEKETLNPDDINNINSDINSEEKTSGSFGVDKRCGKNIFNNSEGDIKIGDFLLAFFKFYGFEFDYKHYGFSLNGKNFGQTFKKMKGYQENCVSVESIEQEEIDIGIKCFNYDKIVDLFQRTYFKIKMERDSNIFSILNSLEFPCE